jgi:hypothetical protein
MAGEEVVALRTGFVEPSLSLSAHVNATGSSSYADMLGDRPLTCPLAAPAGFDAGSGLLLRRAMPGEAPMAAPALM